MVENKKVEALNPIKEKKNWKEWVKAIGFLIITLALYIVFVISAVAILGYYILSIKNNGLFNAETVRIGIYLIIAAYLFLILDKKKIKDAFGIKDVPYIPLEQTKGINCLPRKENKSNF